MTRQECKALAKEQLRGAWGQVAIVTLVILLVAAILGALCIIPIVGWIPSLVALPLLDLGYVRYFLKKSRNEPVEMGTVFSIFSEFKAYWGRSFVTMLLVILWSLLYCLPGIVLMFVGSLQLQFADYGEIPAFAVLLMIVGYVLTIAGSIWVSLRYGLYNFILLEHPELRATQVLQKNAEIIKGHMKEFFVLQLSFLGWILLCGLTFGIGLLWLQPYMMQTITNYYHTLEPTQAFPEQE